MDNNGFAPRSAGVNARDLSLSNFKQFSTEKNV